MYTGKLESTKKISRFREQLTPVQLSYLQTYFKNNPFPTVEESMSIAKDLGTSDLCITRWFKRYRFQKKDPCQGVIGLHITNVKMHEMIILSQFYN